MAKAKKAKSGKRKLSAKAEQQRKKNWYASMLKAGHIKPGKKKKKAKAKSKAKGTKPKAKKMGRGAGIGHAPAIAPIIVRPAARGIQVPA